MELEEMKTLWEEMSERVEKLELVNEQNIMEMTQEKYTKKFNKLLFYERSGAAICIIMGIVLLLNIEKLDTWYLMTCGIFSVVTLLILPVISLSSLKRMTSLNLSQNSYRETLIRFKKSRDRVLLLQRGGVILSVLFALVVIPVMDKIFNDNDFFTKEISTGYWIFLAVSMVALFFFARWGYGCYKSIAKSAENVLKELED
jgi:magnesium-transporting ATPase (P-type)